MHCLCVYLRNKGIGHSFLKKIIKRFGLFNTIPCR
jgi:hypothetical protein